MNKRRMAVRLTVAGLVIAAGVGAAATPAMAMSPECRTFAYWNRRAVVLMSQDGISAADFSYWFDMWVQTERDLANC